MQPDLQPLLHGIRTGRDEIKHTPAGKGFGSDLEGLRITGRRARGGSLLGCEIRGRLEFVESRVIPVRKPGDTACGRTESRRGIP